MEGLLWECINGIIPASWIKKNTDPEPVPLRENGFRTQTDPHCQDPFPDLDTMGGICVSESRQWIRYNALWTK